MRRLTFIAALVALLLGLVAGPARADDAAVNRAWDADDAAFTKLGKQYRHELRKWAKRGNRKPEKALKSNAKARKLLKKTRAGVVAATPSTTTGGRAKKYAIASMDAFAKQLRLEARAIRQITKRHKSEKTERAAARYAKKARRLAKKGKKLFRQAAAEAAP